MCQSQNSNPCLPGYHTLSLSRNTASHRRKAQLAALRSSLYFRARRSRGASGLMMCLSLPQQPRMTDINTPPARPPPRKSQLFHLILSRKSETRMFVVTLEWIHLQWWEINFILLTSKWETPALKILINKAFSPPEIRDLFSSEWGLPVDSS